LETLGEKPGVFVWVRISMMSWTVSKSSQHGNGNIAVTHVI